MNNKKFDSSRELKSRGFVRPKPRGPLEYNQIDPSFTIRAKNNQGRYIIFDSCPGLSIGHNEPFRFDVKSDYDIDSSIAISIFCIKSTINDRRFGLGSKIISPSKPHNKPLVSKRLYFPENLQGSGLHGQAFDLEFELLSAGFHLDSEIGFWFYIKSMTNWIFFENMSQPERSVIGCMNKQKSGRNMFSYKLFNPISVDSISESIEQVAINASKSSDAPVDFLKLSHPIRVNRLDRSNKNALRERNWVKMCLLNGHYFVR